MGEQLGVLSNRHDPQGRTVLPSGVAFVSYVNGADTQFRLLS